MPKIIISKETFAELKATARSEEVEAFDNYPPSANGLYEFDIKPETFERLIRYQVEGENLSDALLRMLKTVKGEIQ